MAIEKINIDVNGMTWATCSTGVEKALNKQDGVIKAVVNLLSNRATVEFDPEIIQTTSLISAIEKAGYEVPIVSKTLLTIGSSGKSEKWLILYSS